MEDTLILEHHQISLKLDRIAWQIIEQHYGEDEIVLIGLADRGFDVAEKIYNRIIKNTNSTVHLLRLLLDKSAPLTEPIIIESNEKISDRAIILVDDVLNSGITMAAAFKKVLEFKPKSVRTAVLANRDHHKFPIQANYVGISLATTLKEHISYSEVNGEMSITLR